MKEFLLIVYILFLAACTDRSSTPTPDPSPHGAMIGRRFWTCQELAEAYQETLAENARLRAQLGMKPPKPPTRDVIQERKSKLCKYRIGCKDDG